MFSSKDLFFTPAAGGYTVSKSLRFRASASAYLNRTSVASPTNVKKYTVSVWAKLSKLGDTIIMNTGSSGATGSWIYINSSNQINFNDYCSGSRCQKITTPVYRDPSAFYHIVCTLDTTVPAMKVYVNGVEVTAFGTNTAPTSNANTSLNAASAVVNIGRDTAGASYFDGYLAEYNYIDGQALDPSYFGAFDTSGVWQPITPSVSSYGTNGFYLKFTDTTSTTTLCYDSSGNSNNWTPTNISLTSGATYDSMLDSPTNATGDIGNYCTFNPLVNSSTTTVSGGNLNYTASTGYDAVCTQVPNYKCYFEMTVIAASGTTPVIGMGDVTVYNPWVNNASSVNGAFGTRSTGVVFVNGTSGSTYATYTTGNVVGFAFDPATGKFWYSVNGVWANSGDPDAGTGNVGTATVGLNYVPLAYAATSNGVNANFGQRPFSYAPSSANKNSTFYAINTQNLTAPTITNGAQYMAAVTYTGNGTASTSITASSTNSGNNPNSTTFQPDLVWIKSRSAATNNNLFDSVRTATNYLISNTTAANASNANTLTAFNSNGFTLGTDASSIGVNVNAATYVAWEWLANGSSTTSGTGTGGITSVSYSVNQTAGFSMVYYTGSGTNGTVTHGLGAAPSLIIGKKRSSTGSWQVYHSSISGMAGGYIVLNGTGGFTSGVSTIWNNTAPTSTVFSLGTDTDLNASGATTLAYCWTPISGFSAFGSYTGNGSTDGVFVYTGFRSRWIMFKRTDTTSVWTVMDTSRDTYNVASNRLYPNLANAEDTDTVVDCLSNGFKIRTTGTYVNASGGSYIYAAFAENPFKISRAR